MKLFLISNMYPSSENKGYGIFVKRFKEAVDEEFEVETIVLTKKEGFFSKLIGYTVLYLKIIRLYFVADRKDMIYVHFPLYFSVLLIPIVWKKTPLILNFHGSDIIFNTVMKRFFAVMLQTTVRKCNKVVVPSDYYRKKVGKVFGISNDNFFVYPSGGVDRRTFHPMKKENKDFIFGFVSNFIQKKGWAIFLEALALVNKSDRALPFRAIMVGEGPDRDRIKEEIIAKDLDVTMVKSVKQSKLAEIYAKFSVFVFPTYREEESLGLVGLEALMCGVPVIASKVGGPMGYIKHGLNGYLVEKKNSVDLAEKMIEFQNLSRDNIEKMKRNAVITAQKYESHKVKKELLGLLTKLKHPETYT